MGVLKKTYRDVHKEQSLEDRVAEVQAAPGCCRAGSSAAIGLHGFPHSCGTDHGKFSQRDP